MTTTTFRTAIAAAKEMERIADAYATVYECIWIKSDMMAYSGRILEYRDEMKKPEIGKFSYTETVYIRHRGVENYKARVAELGDEILAILTVSFDKNTKVYTIKKTNYIPE